ncbi:MAG: hypothetical protein ACXQS8_04805 [Candidatus Helarchaeales archaeon]
MSLGGFGRDFKKPKSVITKEERFIEVEHRPPIITEKIIEVEKPIITEKIIEVEKPIIIEKIVIKEVPITTIVEKTTIESSFKAEEKLLSLYAEIAKINTENKKYFDRIDIEMRKFSGIIFLMFMLNTLFYLFK